MSHSFRPGVASVQITGTDIVVPEIPTKNWAVEFEKAVIYGLAEVKGTHPMKEYMARSLSLAHPQAAFDLMIATSGKNEKYWAKIKERVGMKAAVQKALRDLVLKELQ